MSELKPCPFCGGEAEKLFCEDGCCGGRFRWIMCSECGVLDPASHGDDEEMSTRAWNHRPIEDALRARVEALATQLHGTKRVVDDMVKRVEILEAENERLRETVEAARDALDYASRAVTVNYACGAEGATPREREAASDTRAEFSSAKIRFYKMAKAARALREAEGEE